MTDATLKAEALARRFRHIAATRMQGLPLLHPALHVEAVGFAWQQIDTPLRGGVLGVLVTPWCMNLVWLPDPGQERPTEGTCRHYRIGDQHLGFTAVEDEVVGHYQSCSLFSPMFDFVDADAARETAVQVLSLLRRPPVETPVDLGRRGLFGRLLGQAT